MESEEAIMENENNCNVESESNTRIRDERVVHHVLEMHDLSPAVTLDNEGDSDMNSVSDDVLDYTSTTVKHQAVGYSDDHIDRCEVTSVCASNSNVTGIDIPDYEDLVQADEVSQQQGSLRVRDSRKANNDLVIDELQVNGNSSEIRLEEVMEENNITSHAFEKQAEDQAKPSIETYQMDVDEDVEAAFQSLQAGDDQVKELGVNDCAMQVSESLEMGAHHCKTTPVESSTILEKKYWDDEVDLLEDTKNSYSHGGAPAACDISVPTLNDNFSSVEVSQEMKTSLANQNIVSNEASKQTRVGLTHVPEIEMTEQHSPELDTIVILPEAGNLTAIQLKYSTDIPGDKASFETPQSSHTENELYGLKDDEDVDVLQMKSSPSSGEGITEVAALSVAVSCDAAVPLSVSSDAAVTERVQIHGGILSLGDSLQDVDKFADDKFQESEIDNYQEDTSSRMSSSTSEIDINQEDNSSRISSNISETEHRLLETYSDHLDSGEANVTALEYVSKSVEGRDVTCVSAMPVNTTNEDYREGGNHTDNDAAQDKDINSREGIAEVNSGSDDVIKLRHQETSHQETKHQEIEHEEETVQQEIEHEETEHQEIEHEEAEHQGIEHEEVEHQEIEDKETEHKQNENQEMKNENTENQEIRHQEFKQEIEDQDTKIQESNHKKTMHKETEQEETEKKKTECQKTEHEEYEEQDSVHQKTEKEKIYYQETELHKDEHQENELQESEHKDIEHQEKELKEGDDPSDTVVQSISTEEHMEVTSNVEVADQHPEGTAVHEDMEVSQTCVQNNAHLQTHDAQSTSSQTHPELMETGNESNAGSVVAESDDLTGVSESANDKVLPVEADTALASNESTEEGHEKSRQSSDDDSVGGALLQAVDLGTKPEADAAEVAEVKTDLKTSDNNELMDSSSGDVKHKAGATKIGVGEDDVVVVDDEGKVVPVKDEVVEQKVTENGVGVKASPAPQPQQRRSASARKISAAGGGSAETNKTDSSKTKSSRSKFQTCLVCQKICKCKYNIVRNGDVKHLCDDACFKQFRKTPSVFLKGVDESKMSKAAKDAESASVVKESLAAYQPEIVSPQISPYKTCSVCQLINVNTSQPFCNWKGLDFCGESCLGKFQASLNTSCSFCHAYIPIDMRATFCFKIGNDIRPFCKQRCYNEFKKKLRLCSFCQRDVAGVPGAFTTMVGTGGKFREFCSQACMKKLESHLLEVEFLSVDKGSLKPETAACSLCEKQGPVKCAIRLQGKMNKLCSESCLSTFKHTNKINLEKCDQCGNMCMPEETQAHFVQYEGQMKCFCGDNCVSLFRKAKSRVIQCDWCTSKKLNFDMIERLDAGSKYQVFCSLNCLSLFRVNQQAKSGQAVSCDHCQKAAQAQYHLTMSDASVRNFCSYSCVMTFQSQFTSKHTSVPGLPANSALPPTQVQQLQQPKTPSPRGGRGRMHTRQATAKQQSSFPVISNVVSLAQPGADGQPQSPSQITTNTAAVPSAVTSTGNVVASADGKHQILIQAASPKYGRNKSLQCKPLTQTKATSCRPHSQTKETQTDEVPIRHVLVPVPVPVYLPMPTVMYTAPAPRLLPIPIPIPVPIFIPTTRKSANGISKAIQDIVERMPSDPLEAELLMMAEAVAADRRPGDSDTDSEAENGAEDFNVPAEDVLRPSSQEDESLMMRKREAQGEEDMIQMALRMAEEMSGPIEDLETSVEPVPVSAEAPQSQQHPTIQAYDSQVDDDYIPPRSYQNRGAKRPNRGRPLSSRVKRPRSERSYNDDESVHSARSEQPQTIEPPPDANYRLKFTYGVNAWRHWVITKNAQIEKARNATGSQRLRTFSTDILKCTTDELNFSLGMFIKEVRKPNGEEYSPDSIYYLCLGIQQYLYENGRIDNIFTDSYFEKFTDCLNDILKTLRPKINSQGQMLCRIEEEHLWESKQLGAHSPFILLNTLIYFHTKHFILKTAQEHMSLSFAQILKHWKKGMPVKGQNPASGKNVSLRFYCLANGKKDGLAARKNKDGVPVYEVTENFDNPLRCPVKLYEFFLSKCPESIKNRNDIFYPVPERSCVPDSPVWYSTQSIDVHTMDKMLTRLLLVREIQEAHLHAQPIYL